MFECPEFVILSRQFNEALHGKVVRYGSLGNSPHKFVWYNRKPDEFASLVAGRIVGTTTSRGRWLFVPLEPDYVLVLGECGGRVLLHAPGASLPAKYHMLLAFEDGYQLTATTQMWGAMELFDAGAEQERQYIKGMRPTPLDPVFTFEYFTALVDELVAGKKRSVKALLTQDQLVPGLGNAIAQDIMFAARLHPRRSLADLEPDQLQALFDAIVTTVDQVIAAGGRYDETDLYGRPGGYVRVMDQNALARPCPVCGGPIEKIQHLGGACYLCPNCQR